MIRKSILGMEPYSPPLEGRSERDALLLDFNERTIPVSTHITDVLTNYIKNNSLQQYPEYGTFTKQLADYAEVEENQVLFTNGSDHGIDIIYRAVTEPGDEVIIPSPTFAMLQHCAAIQGVTIRSPHYSFKNGYPFNEVCDLVSEKTKLIVVCSPNNPTGTILIPEKIAELAQSFPTTAVLIDECYFEFSSHTAKKYINSCPNIFITRTFSKTWGLPSLRLGYIISAGQNIKELNKIRGAYEVNKLAVVAVSAAISKPAFMRQYVDEVMNQAKPLLEEYLSSQGFIYWPSSGNFLLVHVKDALKVTQKLATQGILVRPRSGSGIDNTVRITIGTKDQTNQLIEALNTALLPL